MKSINKNTHIPSFDTIRGLAIFIVVLSHNHVMVQGGVGNDICFMLSGFMAAFPFAKVPFEDSFLSLKSVLTYYRNRLTKILPSFWTVIFLAYIVYPNHYFKSSNDLFSHMFLKNVNSSNGHIWFLQNTILLYILTPFIGLIIHLLIMSYEKIFNKNYTYIVITVILLIIANKYQKLSIIPTSIMMLKGGEINFYLGPYMIGIAFAYFYGFLSNYKMKTFSRIYDVLSFLVLLFPVYTCRAILFRLNPKYIKYYIGWERPNLCAFIFGFLLILLLLNPNGKINKILSFTPFTIVGKVSYEIYLSHWYLLPLVNGITNKYTKALTCFALSLGLSLCLYTLVAKPISTLIKTKKWHSFLESYKDISI